MSEIQAGDGWRLLGPDEVIRKGDEHYTGNNWIETEDMGFVVAEDTYRRRIPAKPEAMVVDDRNGQLAASAALSDCCLVQIGGGRGRETIVLSGTQEARQLADWLTRYADWREAQDSVAKTPPN